MNGKKTFVHEGASVLGGGSAAPLPEDVRFRSLYGTARPGVTPLFGDLVCPTVDPPVRLRNNKIVAKTSSLESLPGEILDKIIRATLGLYPQYDDGYVNGIKVKDVLPHAILGTSRCLRDQSLDLIFRTFIWIEFRCLNEKPHSLMNYIIQNTQPCLNGAFYHHMQPERITLSISIGLPSVDGTDRIYEDKGTYLTQYLAYSALNYAWIPLDLSRIRTRGEYHQRFKAIQVFIGSPRVLPLQELEVRLLMPLSAFRNASFCTIDGVSPSFSKGLFLQRLQKSLNTVEDGIELLADMYSMKDQLIEMGRNADAALHLIVQLRHDGMVTRLKSFFIDRLGGTLSILQIEHNDPLRNELQTLIRRGFLEACCAVNKRNKVMNADDQLAKSLRSEGSQWPSAVMPTTPHNLSVELGNLALAWMGISDQDRARAHQARGEARLIYVKFLLHLSEKLNDLNNDNVDETLNKAGLRRTHRVYIPGSILPETIMEFAMLARLDFECAQDLDYRFKNHASQASQELTALVEMPAWQGSNKASLLDGLWQGDRRLIQKWGGQQEVEFWLRDSRRHTNHAATIESIIRR